MIKGMCENCGFTYQGEISVPFTGIACPNCGKETNNFDSVAAVDALNKDEGTVLDYTPSILKPLA